MTTLTNPAAARLFSDGDASGPGSCDTVIIGIGNNLMTDDGAGIHVIDQLRKLDLPDNVELVDGGTLGFTLLDIVERARRLIVVDAAQMDREPGEVEVFEDARMDVYLTNCRRSSVHEVNLLDVIGAARFRGNMPERYALVGIQPDCVDWGAEPTAAVAGGVEQATAIIADMVAEECVA